MTFGNFGVPETQSYVADILIKCPLVGLPEGEASPFICTTLNSLPLGCFMQNFVKSYPLWCLLEGQPLYLYNFECPLPKDASCQIWLKSAQYFRRCCLKQKVMILSKNYPFLSPLMVPLGCLCPFCEQI